MRAYGAAAAAALLCGVAAAQEGGAPEPPEHDGRWLYQRNCESCHGATGDGQGPLSLQLGKPARSFAAGGFAFGNTREALYRTVTAGMPGSVMPGFQGTLTEEERWRVVDWVRANLMPEQPPDEVELTVIELVDRPAIVRGYLPPIVEGAPMRPRGLLVGYPEGLTFEYRIDDVRLLGVRFGGFVDRTDWNGRGGTPLKPLGQVIHLFGGGDPPPTFVDTSGSEWVPLQARLDRTKTYWHSAWIEYELADLEGHRRATIEEGFWVKGISTGPAYRRTVKFSSSLLDEREAKLALLLASWDGEPRFVHGFGADPGARIEIDGKYWLGRQVAPNEFEHILIEHHDDRGASLVSDGASLRLEFQDDPPPMVVGRPPFSTDIAYFRTAAWSWEQLERVAAELKE